MTIIETNQSMARGQVVVALVSLPLFAFFLAQPPFGVPLVLQRIFIVAMILTSISLFARAAPQAYRPSHLTVEADDLVLTRWGRTQKRKPVSQLRAVTGPSLSLRGPGRVLSLFFRDGSHWDVMCVAQDAELLRSRALLDEMVSQ